MIPEAMIRESLEAPDRSLGTLTPLVDFVARINNDGCSNCDYPYLNLDRHYSFGDYPYLACDFPHPSCGYPHPYCDYPYPYIGYP